MTFQFEKMNLIYVIDTIQIKLYKKSRSMFFTVFHLDMLPGSFLISITDECFVFLPEEGDVILSAYDTLVSKVTMTGRLVNVGAGSVRETQPFLAIFAQGLFS